MDQKPYAATKLTVQISRESKLKLEERFPEIGKTKGCIRGFGVTPSFNYDLNPPMDKESVIDITKELYDLQVGYWQFITTEANKIDESERDESLKHL